MDGGLKSILTHAAAVGAGGFVGSLARFGLGGLVHRLFPLTTFPYGTLVVNLLGCLGVGMLTGFIESRELVPSELRVFALAGLLGGFTTFSAFGNDTVAMLRSAEYARAAGNVGTHLAVGLFLVWLGHSLVASR